MNKVRIGMFSLLFAVSSQGATLASWENDALEGKEASAKSSRASSDLKEAPVIEREYGLAGASYLNSFAARNADKASLEDAISEDCYMTWTLQAKEGSQLNLSDMMIRLSAQNASTYSVKFVLFTDKTGFLPGNEIATYSVGGNGDDPLGVVFKTDLMSIAALQGAQYVEFRLYIFGQDGPYTQVAIGRGWNQDGAVDLKIGGAVTPIPTAPAPAAEPALAS